MKVSCLPLLACTAQAIRIVQSNDDGWAELFLRSFNDALQATGHEAVVSAPAENKSGTSSLDAEPKDRRDACEYDSCPPNSGAFGSNATRPELNWVNSFPVTSMRFGIERFGPALWDGEAPELAVAGPNVGTNIWVQVPFSGTVGAAAYAAHEAGIPSIAFSTDEGTRHRWDTSPVPPESLVYAELATTLTNKVIASGKPYLPDDVFLNVNLPKASADCDASSVKWVLSRINPGLFSAPDVAWCGSERLPTELKVFQTDGCFASISVGDAADKTTVDAERQAIVLDKLKDILTCLP
ncbi:survival protein sure-like phosphatase/nucleotidase [Stachybotrys elegans]|uniref:Survival protein sure-like phosphatase/nucleotidase n=1 Tax=Stachybotrys elegans TaxID=80388 RepID=A0A8K0WK31_9HYPO|nr:survival protein sure-like phosphatase/nucleotidase [Stachybotrys elegans]